ncbi:MAG: V-type ATP synthase subunit K [Candidatus Margulisbacteria bacterium]|jgi:V/A-type H+-transporting ATPase subunit K|nr:V-type ATP synthase subunit K [Candidatus Margulisiibacteriota bacterium]
MDTGLMFAILGASLALAGGGIGSSVGVGLAGEVAAGVVAEDPDKFGKTLLLQALPGTQGIYGFLAAFWVILKINLLGGAAPVSPEAGLQILFACLAVGINALISGIFQGRAAAAGIAMVGRKPDEVGKGMIFAAMVETYAVLGLLLTILLLNGIQL